MDALRDICDEMNLLIDGYKEISYMDISCIAEITITTATSTIL